MEPIKQLSSLASRLYTLTGLPTSEDPTPDRTERSRTLDTVTATISIIGLSDHEDNSSNGDQDRKDDQPDLNEVDGISSADSKMENMNAKSTENVSTTIVQANRFNPFDEINFDRDTERFTQLRHPSSLPVLHDITPDKKINDLLVVNEDHFSDKQNDLELTNMEDLEFAIEECKQEVMSSSGHKERQREAMNKLVNLRLRVQELKESPDDSMSDMKRVAHHTFELFISNSSKHYCEKCCAVIWGILQNWYQCQGCGFNSHSKCLTSITRTCAALRVEQSPTYILDICPETSLAAQNYKCVECKASLSFKGNDREPRQCDYTGLYYCDMCHWNDIMIIPARVLHNWDLEPRKVSRASKQFLKLMMRKPVIRINDVNPMLFNFVDELNEVKKLREEILIMKVYFLSCKSALDSKLLLQLSERQHFVDDSDMYSLQDLIDVAYDVLLPSLAKIHTSFAQHIKSDCELCKGKGYICELCKDPEEILFPFDNIALVCANCSTVLHRHCYIQKKQTCAKCERLNRRKVPEAS